MQTLPSSYNVKEAQYLYQRGWCKGQNGKLTRISLLQNLPNYIASVKEKLPKSGLNELKKREVYQTAPEIHVALRVQTFTWGVLTSVAISPTKDSAE